ncbi:ABC transporter substrate-binding protein [Kitasatospora purpeofusca]|uniref:ABC transporter substrate-binding protein n=1 Tax=Kitasatospora purpeofusca TaxID=67352 RepID=UPI0035DD66B1
MATVRPPHTRGRGGNQCDGGNSEPPHRRPAPRPPHSPAPLPCRTGTPVGPPPDTAAATASRTGTRTTRAPAQGEWNGASAPEPRTAHRRPPAAAAKSSDGKAGHAVTRGLTCIPNIQFAPFHVAESKGFHKEVVLSLTLRHPVFTDALLGAPTAGREDLVHADGDEMLQARAEDMPVVDVADLRRRTVGTPDPYGETHFGTGCRGRRVRTAPRRRRCRTPPGRTGPSRRPREPLRRPSCSAVTLLFERHLSGEGNPLGLPGCPVERHDDTTRGRDARSTSTPRGVGYDGAKKAPGRKRHSETLPAVREQTAPRSMTILMSRTPHRDDRARSRGPRQGNLGGRVRRGRRPGRLATDAVPPPPPTRQPNGPNMPRRAGTMPELRKPADQVRYDNGFVRLSSSNRFPAEGLEPELRRRRPRR